MLLLAAWLTGRAGAETLKVLELAAVAVGASTFVPAAVRNLFTPRHVGVGTLMTIAAVGAVALGQFFEAAMLGVLFSIAEGLEHYAVVRTPAWPARPAQPGPRHRLCPPRRTRGPTRPRRPGAGRM
ncbi:hypothetical protein ACH4MW_00505 [Streptomyces luteogriseus]|uniref:hypothetical protein n=1 Tax=Streptomyces luteogriseus TaxID=68233 RepID=UPI0037AA6384